MSPLPPVGWTLPLPHPGIHSLLSISAAHTLVPALFPEAVTAELSAYLTAFHLLPTPYQSVFLPVSRKSLRIQVIQGVLLLESPPPPPPHWHPSPFPGPEGAPALQGPKHIPYSRAVPTGSLNLCQEKGGFQLPLQTRGSLGTFCLRLQFKAITDEWSLLHSGLYNT
ncbi:hypothetical protein mRhiFer1_010099 [Rhinolophus ferrumequinum]|uniref:Uncharacterized protein n=1 Tax=Rhinolophus ferrumequinum TaxID=59479 RepID=A0A7J7XPV0_RHIFE|nr:hypothetical protein mRhiFer1_010099 [Rhinolophus ferrumequinum]